MQLGVVRRHDDRDALPAQGRDARTHDPSGCLIEVRRRLVEQCDARAGRDAGEHPCEGEATLLPRREPCRVGIGKAQVGEEGDLTVTLGIADDNDDLPKKIKEVR